ncbi:MAG: hypothetical protein N2109_04340 [Fimbriimonadales bacterium]|nr:hypothetical protein [Fimbriimonadales bacterium]
MAAVRRAAPYLILLLAALLPVGRAVFGAEAVGAFDQIRQMPPWNGPKPKQAWDILQADSVLQFYVWRKLVIEDGLTWVNPYSFGGSPLAANSQSAVWYPPHVQLRLVRMRADDAVDLLAWFHLFVLGAGVYALCKVAGAASWPALASALGVQLSPFALAWLGLASVPTTVAWIPWLLTATVLCLRGRPWAWFAVAASGGLLLTAGHLQFAAYGLLASIAVALHGLWESRSWRGLAAWAVGGALAAALAWVHLGPVLALSGESHRQGPATEEGYAAYVGGAIRPHELVGRLASPFAQGNPLVEPDGLPTEYLPAITRPGANYAESASTIGPLLLVGALAALAGPRRRQAILWWGVALLAALLAVGTPLNRLLYFGLPGWSASGSPGRVVVLMLLALAVAAALGFSPQAASKGGDRARVAAIAAAFLVMAVGVVWGEEPYPAGLPDSHPAEVVWMEVFRRNGAMVLLWGFAALLVAPVVWERPRLGWLLAAFSVAFPVATGVTALVRTGDPSFLRERIEGVGPSDLVAIVNEHWTFVGAPRALMPPNTAAAAGIRELGGYDSLMRRAVKAELDAINGRDSSPPANGNIAFVQPTADPDRLRRAGVTQVWSLRALPPSFGPGERHPRGFWVYRL